MAKPSRAQARCASGCFAVGMLIAVVGRAEPTPTPVGETASALRGVHRVGVALPNEATNPRVAATLGYGLTEAQARDDALHQRLSLTLAGAISPFRFLDLGLRADARYDRHSSAQQSPGGAVLDARATARLSTLLSRSAYLGTEVVGWLPGTERLSTSFDAFSVDVRTLGGFYSAGSAFGFLLGFRFDRSEAAAQNRARLNPGDRLALGLSQYNAALLGIGGAYRLRRAELLAEATADVLVGKGAPQFRESPLRLAVGTRARVSSRVSLQGMLEASLSARPTQGPSAPLIPVEPRLTLLFGVGFDGGAPSRAAPQLPPLQREPARAPTALATPVTGTLEVTLRDVDGGLIDDAEVSIESGGHSDALEPSGAGRYRLDLVPLGPVTLHVNAPNCAPMRREVTVSASQPVRLDLVPERSIPLGQVRGLVRSFRGRGLAADIEIEPLAAKARSGSDGFFQIDVPPGQYTIVISTAGYAVQRRKVVVQKNGVVVINADLAGSK